MSDPEASHQEVSIALSDRERAVVRNALDHHLDTTDEDTPGRDRLERHYRTATESGTISVRAGAADTYRTVFREYAQALQRTVDEDAAGESMAEFFEAAFKSVIVKIRDATEA